MADSTNGWVPVSRETLDADQWPDWYRPEETMWVATESYGVVAAVYEWRQGRHPHRFYTAGCGELGLGDVTHIKQYQKPAPPTTPTVTRKAFVCVACQGVYVDSPVTQCDCMPDKQQFIGTTITYSTP